AWGHVAEFLQLVQHERLESCTDLQRAKAWSMGSLRPRPGDTRHVGMLLRRRTIETDAEERTSVRKPLVQSLLERIQHRRERIDIAAVPRRTERLQGAARTLDRHERELRATRRFVSSVGGAKRVSAHEGSKHLHVDSEV